MTGKDGLMGRLLDSADKFNDKQIAETLEMVVAQGVKRGASDIHIEPHDRFVQIRFRIDGALRGLYKLPRKTLESVMAQLKTAADLNSAETRAPQEGQYVIETEGRKVDVRVSTMPVFGGEKAVLHLSLERGKPNELAELGFWGDNLKTLSDVLATPHGLVLVAGPKHSGKSATLFSLLDTLSSPMVGIATVELHPKHRLPGVNRTYLTGGGMTMTEGLAAALKQDPNIIMLSDLPDHESAELAVHAATTGHLLLAGLHAESASHAILRIRAAGVEPFLLVTALRVAVGQRLVRTLCPNCRERYGLDDDDQKALYASFGITNVAAVRRIHELEQRAAEAIFGDVKQLSSSPNGITHLWRASEHGCDHCDHSGFVGQTAIVEVLKNTENLHKTLLNREVTSASTIQKNALKDGLIPMALDGLIKALCGQTTVGEVLRAVSG